MGRGVGFSALQRAEIAEMSSGRRANAAKSEVSVLFNEPKLLKSTLENDLARSDRGFSALQRAEIAEIVRCYRAAGAHCADVSVLFNEPKLLK